MYKFIFEYAKKFWWQIALMLFLTVVSAQINLELPSFTSRIINEGVAMQNMARVWELGLQMTAFALAGGLVMIASMFFSSRIAAGISKNLRHDAFEKVEEFSMKEFGKFSVSSLVTRISNDTSQVQQTFSMSLRMGVYAIFIGIGAVINVFSISATMSWVLAGSVAAIFVMVAIVTVFAVSNLKKIQENLDALNLQTRQTITGLRIIRAFRNDKVEEEKFAKVNERNAKTYTFVDRVFGLISPYMTLVGGVSSVAVVWLGANFVETGEMNVGDIFALVQYVGQVIFAFVMLSIIFTFLPRMAVSSGRLQEIMNTKVSVSDEENAVSAPENFDITFEDVSFKYDGGEDYVLRGLNFEVVQGETVAIIGGTGSGKSTVAKLLPRFFDVNEGVIKIGGVDISKMAQKDLRNLIAYTPQKASLFSGDILSNVAYGADATDEKNIVRALKIAQAWDFVSKLPDGIKSDVSQGGKNFSGGQKQRLSIARSLAKNAPILIFDDSFSALDYKTDAKLRAELAKKTKGQTKFIVAQRVASIAHADKIIVLDGGQIAAMGTHGELLSSSEIYREIALSQLSEAEVEAQISAFEASKNPTKKSSKKGQK